MRKNARITLWRRRRCVWLTTCTNCTPLPLLRRSCAVAVVADGGVALTGLLAPSWPAQTDSAGVEKVERTRFGGGEFELLPYACWRCA